MNLQSQLNVTSTYKGKVRDVYTVDNQFLVMVASNRISAFDVILPREIPYKGQVLNQVAAYMLNATKHICPNWLLSSPAPNVSVGKKCDPFKIELVVRGNLTGHAWRTYESGKRILCGVALPEGMKEHDFFEKPIITPSTKAAEGHDEDISATEIIELGLATQAEWEQLCTYSLALFEFGKQKAAAQGLILVDTKYEFGKIDDTIYLIDEIHTPDSSRYFYADSEKDNDGHFIDKPKQLSKEFVREWLIENNFMGKEGQTVPEMTDDWINTISNRYIELYEHLIGKSFEPLVLSEAETISKIETSIKTLTV
jgi:phosphoribosylaminoimidazole-succinocarboxamide synthase